MIDLHMHSSFSPDSKESLDTYFKHTTEDVVVTTEHLDYMQTGNNHSIPDYRSQVAEVNRCSEQYEVKGLVGIEVGYTIESEERVIEFLSDKQYDFKILSIHQDDISDYLYKADGYVVDLEYYFNSLISGLTNIDGIDSLGHLDYPFRNNQLDDSFFTNPKLQVVLSLLIEKGVALEINTRSLYQFDNLEFYRQLLPIYNKLGGKLISIASDAHSLSYYQYHFADAVELINRLGNFEYINHKY